MPGTTLPFDDDACYRVLEARDARWDGRFFVGVTSTGVYCRPICRVRTPSRRNCRFFATAAQAEAATFRPCLKCRPEIAPGPGLAWSVMDASRTLARQAAAALDEGLREGEVPSITTLATHLGVSDRHLRRIFLAQHGVTPLRYVQTRRLHLAKQLLTDTALPVAQVALCSGYGSLRRFNAAFAADYRLAPTRLRRRTNGATPARDSQAESAFSVQLAYRPPYDSTGLLRFLADRAVAGVESVDADARRIQRSVRAGVLAPQQPAAWLAVEFPVDRDRVTLTASASLAPHGAGLIAAARRWLDLDAAPDAIAAALHDLPGEAGLRLPGSVDPFELALRAVLGQQVTVAAARTLARRLVERFGTAIETPHDRITRTFPDPDTLARTSTSDIASLGIVASRAEALRAMADAWPRLAPLLAAGSDPAPLVQTLDALPGIGPWTAHYIAMRALGWCDAFPPGDIAALKAMRTLIGTTHAKEAVQHAERWRPWRAYALLRLWRTL